MKKVSASEAKPVVFPLHCGLRLRFCSTDYFAPLNNADLACCLPVNFSAQQSFQTTTAEMADSILTNPTSCAAAPLLLIWRIFLVAVMSLFQIWKMRTIIIKIWQRKQNQLQIGGEGLHHSPGHQLCGRHSWTGDSAGQTNKHRRSNFNALSLLFERDWRRNAS